MDFIYVPIFSMQYFYNLPTPYTPFFVTFIIFLLLRLQIMLCFVCLCAIVYLCNMRYTKAVVGTEVQYLSDDPQKTQTGSFSLSLFFVSAIYLCNLFEYYNILCTNWRINWYLLNFGIPTDVYSEFFLNSCLKKQMAWDLLEIPYRNFAWKAELAKVELILKWTFALLHFQMLLT